LIGSAQVWRDDALLQQGSLPLDDHAAEFFAMLRYPSDAERAKALALYCTKTAPLHTFVPQATWDDVANAFHTGFTAALHEDFVPGEVTTSEWELAYELVETKYSKLEWRQERISLV
jgi:lipoate-protein ligase A